MGSEEQQGKNMCVVIRCMDLFVISCMELRGLERLFVISVQHVSHSRKRKRNEQGEGGAESL